ncbi:AT-hook motif nuclear-localized protein 10-like [Phalaenopsis equestris]|uniref:AT-hook motif nuclear-localized protein 10-like n=1 Tax=Phalaenopsis equestris TaxID=78828 RepID=UPI0009E5507A|nr:AT-hook motif nuclear-localized protein 10-like [Phalaenopsis equestris]XP_020576016.1 AT-hook motif nuclear-localized protein 10-like [Phalaenopsis equestris]
MEVRSEQSFSIGMQNFPVPTKPSISSMRLTVTNDGTAVYKQVTSATNATPVPTIASVSAPPFPGGNSAVCIGSDGSPAPPVAAIHGLNVTTGELVKKKRGRPRKYAPDGTMALALNPVSPTSGTPPGIGGFSPLSMGQGNIDLSVQGDPMKKIKGRPLGSGKKQQLLALGSAGTGFTPHVIAVKAGEDVSAKIMSFSQHGPRAICILSANGAISNVTLRQAATSGGTVTYEGRFEILSLSGSFLLSESGGQRSRTGGLSVSLAGPDGRVLGGGVAGLLTAASPVQVVVASFIADGKKERKHVNLLEGAPALEKLAPVGGIPGSSGGVMTGGSSPPSRGTPSESSGGPASPLNHSNNSNPQTFSSFLWK